MEEHNEIVYGMRKSMSFNNEVKSDNPFLKHQPKPMNPFMKGSTPPPAYNPFLHKAMIHSKSEVSMGEMNSESSDGDDEDELYLSDYMEKCQLTPSTVSLNDITSLFQHNMYKSIVDSFYPIHPKLASSNLPFYFDHCFFVCRSLIHLNRVDEANALIETCKEYYKKPILKRMDSDRLPDDLSHESTRSSAFPLRLLILQQSIRIIQQEEQAVVDLLSLLDLLWLRLSNQESSHTWWSSCQALHEEEILPMVQWIEELVIHALLTSYNVTLLEDVLNRWIEQHAQTNLPLHILYFVKMKLLFLLGRESQLPSLLDGYTEKLGKQDIAVLFVPLAQAIQAMTAHAFAEAIPLLEQVADHSSSHTFQLIATTNAAICYYHLKEIQNAMNTLEGFMWKDPEHNVNREIIRLLSMIYEDSYPKDECEDRKRAIQLLLKRYHNEIVTLSDFNL